eukprot:15190402-Alexandrium_andersonii.AAC.1
MTPRRGAAAVAWLPGPDGAPAPAAYLLRFLPRLVPLVAEAAGAGLAVELVWHTSGGDRRARA